MAIYRKKPIEVEAIQFVRENIENVKNFCKDIKIFIPKSPNEVMTGKTKTSIINEYDYIVKNKSGDFFIYKKEMFEQLFEL